MKKSSDRTSTVKLLVERYYVLGEAVEHASQRRRVEEGHARARDGAHETLVEQPRRASEFNIRKQTFPSIKKVTNRSVQFTPALNLANWTRLRAGRDEALAGPSPARGAAQGSALAGAAGRGGARWGGRPRRRMLGRQAAAELAGAAGRGGARWGGRPRRRSLGRQAAAALAGAAGRGGARGAAGRGDAPGALPVAMTAESAAGNATQRARSEDGALRRARSSEVELAASSLAARLQAAAELREEHEKASARQEKEPPARLASPRVLCPGPEPDADAAASGSSSRLLQAQRESGASVAGLHRRHSSSRSGVGAVRALFEAARATLPPSRRSSAASASARPRRHSSEELGVDAKPVPPIPLRSYHINAAPMLALRIDRSGPCGVEELGRVDVLQIARQAMPDAQRGRAPGSLIGGPIWSRSRAIVATDSWKGGEVPPRAASASSSSSFRAGAATTCPHGGRRRREWVRALQPRDIRVLDPNCPNARDPEVLVRHHSVLLNLSPIKALVTRSFCLVFVPSASADGLLGGILLRAQQLCADRERDSEPNQPPAGAEEPDDALPLELAMYENILASVCDHAEDKYQALVPVVVQTISQVLRSTSGPVVIQLRNLEQELAHLGKSVSKNRAALVELCDSDRDMALMLLSEVADHPERFAGLDEEHWTADHSPVELLLESYLQRLDGVLRAVRDLEEELASSRAITTLRLRTAQNKVLGVELIVKCVTAVYTAMQLLPAALTMNLDIERYYQDNVAYFWTIFIVLSLGGPVTVLLMYMAIKRRGILIN